MPNEIRRKVLIVEDAPGVLNYLSMTVAAAGYEPITAVNGKIAMQMIASHCPDCILLDLGLPDMDGGTIIESVRKWTQTPIIVISARNTEEDKASALDHGADDYITKPFGSVELLARIRTALRHSRASAGNDDTGTTDYYRIGGLEIDYKKLRVRVDGKDAQLTPIEFRLIALLGKHPGRVMTYKTILRDLWGPFAPIDNKILRVHMANIRRKIEKDTMNPQYVFTEIGVGYRIAEAAPETDA